MEKVIEYNNYLQKIGLFDNPDLLCNRLEDLERVLDSLSQMAQIMRVKQDELTDIKNMKFEEHIDLSYDCTKLLVNTLKYLDVVTPIADKYVPSDDMKDKLKDYILNMENKDE
jgi:hypothetical protein